MDRGNLIEDVKMKTRYRIECIGADGELKWVEEFDNLVVTEGLNLLITRSFKTVPGDVNWYVGLKATGSVVAGDTAASHAGWTEVTTYSQATRPAWTPGTVSGGSLDNSASKAQFSINGTVSVFGAMMINENTKGGTSGALYGAGNFTAQRDVVSGDTLNVQITVSAAAA